jgi:predicted ArsR family transcriptional regulator
MPDKVPQQDGEHVYAGLDRVFHEKARLAIMTSLASQPEGLSFADIKRHLEVLQEVGAISLTRSGAGRSSRTTVRISTAGRREFQRYLAELERVLSKAVRALKETNAKETPNRQIKLSDA